MTPPVTPYNYYNGPHPKQTTDVTVDTLNIIGTAPNSLNLSGGSVTFYSNQTVGNLVGSITMPQAANDVAAAAEGVLLGGLYYDFATPAVVHIRTV